MSGWLDFFKDQICCPFCGKEISILFVEDGSTEVGIPTTISTASGSAECPKCKVIITDSNLTNNLGENNETV